MGELRLIRGSPIVFWLYTEGSYFFEKLSAQFGFQFAVSFAMPFMAWLINCTLLLAWTLVHLGLKPL
jgi:hypothetical protein